MEDERSHTLSSGERHRHEQAAGGRFVDVDVAQDAVVAPAGVKRKAEESSGETPDAKTIILEDPSLAYGSQDLGGHSVSELHQAVEDVGLQFGLNAERTPDGWHGPLPDGSHAYSGVRADYTVLAPHCKAVMFHDINDKISLWLNKMIENIIIIKCYIRN